MIQAKPGKWVWGASDHVVECALRHHVQLVWVIGDTAPWDSRNNDWNGVPKDQNKPDGHYAKFVRALVGRYKGKIHYWEVRNEPNMEYMWHGSMKEYATYLSVAYQIIKEIDKGNSVVLGGLGGGLGEQMKFFRS